MWDLPVPLPEPVVSPEVPTLRAPGYDVFVFPPIEWHARFQRPQQLACQFAAHGHRVFFVDPSLRPGRVKGAGRPIDMSVVRPGISLLSLRGSPRLSIYRDRLGGSADNLAAAFEVLRREQGIVDAVSIVQLPFWGPLATRLRERFGWKLVYDCLDRHSGFSSNAPAMLAEEDALIRDSDLVTTTARALHEELRIRNPDCIVVPNAADFTHFSAFAGDRPLWLRKLPRPIIGYFGAIAEWFDTALVADLARLRPLWSFVLVGGTSTADLRPLRGLPNVYLPGEQPYGVLPAYLHSFDVCLIPFRRLPLTDSTNPVKFYEYLSAGKPVVSVSLPELLPYAPDRLVYLADDPQSFVDRIERALAEDSPDLVDRRKRFAVQHTWNVRFEQLDSATRRLFPKASIIIPTHNNLRLTRLCLDAVFRTTTWPNYEAIVVDNASADETPAYLRDLMARCGSVRCVFNERNEGFARASNQGIVAASGEYLVLLNNDTVVTRGWLTSMIRYLESHPDAGMIGPATNLAGNEARITVAYANLDEMEAFAEIYTREHEDQVRDLAMLGFFCVVIPRRVLDQVGLLDERFGLGMFEDDDLSLRVRRAGYRLVCTDGAFVHHFHSATMRGQGEQEYLRLFETNKAKFEQKWGIRWTPHRYRWQR
jgi:GT2 family glycosyltransferase/glycosyltransferase involved in cell wall biosynthesis